MWPASSANGPVIWRRLVRKHQGHPVDEQRFDDARHESLGQPVEIEIAIEVARKTHKRTPVVIPIAVERAIERILHGVLHRRRQQQRYQRCQKCDDPVVFVVVVQPDALDPLQHRRVDRDDGAERRGVDQRALHDHFDVHQPVPHDG